MAKGRRESASERTGESRHQLQSDPLMIESEVTTVNRCLDAAKACNIDETCQKLRTDPSARSGPCNRPKCNKALRKFFDRVPPDYTHELLFCPCTDTACSERRRQTIVPSCSYEDKEKPNCLAQLRICKADYVCSFWGRGGRATRSHVKQSLSEKPLTLGSHTWLGTCVTSCSRDLMEESDPTEDMESSDPSSQTARRRLIFFLFKCQENKELHLSQPSIRRLRQPPPMHGASQGPEDGFT
ncbi:unnamed protein product [Pleuronectes platessa]|uniref:GDNF/GAS1 domain-containing protein n=1 Tax=Pleuronectes platessa TaxID=8262 RepID=A0A9N7UXV3_PLEPL|nr:unnamed protein product [Pleuronectes platessa]